MIRHTGDWDMSLHPLILNQSLKNLYQLIPRTHWTGNLMLV